VTPLRGGRCHSILGGSAREPDAVAGGAEGGVGGGGSGCGRRVSMTVAEDLLHRHLETLVADNARWQTLIAEDVV
jgi:hypothetical protein